MVHLNLPPTHALSVRVANEVFLLPCVLCVGRSDSVVRVSVNDGKGMKTKLVHDTFAPKFNQAFAFQVSDRSAMVHIKVHAGKKRTDPVIGELSVALATVTANLEDTSWRNLTVQKPFIAVGDAEIELSFVWTYVC